MASDGLMRTYDFTKVIVTFGGVPISGFAAGTGINVTDKSDGWTKKVGADGAIARSKNADDTATVTITLMQTSPSNTYLSTIRTMDRLTNLGIRPLSITDLSGGSLHFWPEAYIVKTPDRGYATEEGDRAWAFETGHPATDLVNGDFIPG
jgi:hypothetical protein